MGIFDFLLNPNPRHAQSKAIKNIVETVKEMFDSPRGIAPRKANLGINLPANIEDDIDYLYSELCLPNCIYELSNNARYLAHYDQASWDAFRKKHHDFIMEMIDYYAYNIFRAVAGSGMLYTLTDVDHSEKFKLALVKISEELSMKVPKLFPRKEDQQLINAMLNRAMMIGRDPVTGVVPEFYSRGRHHDFGVPHVNDIYKNRR